MNIDLAELKKKALATTGGAWVPLEPAVVLALIERIEQLEKRVNAVLLS